MHKNACKGIINESERAIDQLALGDRYSETRVCPWSCCVSCFRVIGTALDVWFQFRKHYANFLWWTPFFKVAWTAGAKLAGRRYVEVIDDFRDDLR